MTDVYKPPDPRDRRKGEPQEDTVLKAGRQQRERRERQQQQEEAENAEERSEETADPLSDPTMHEEFKRMQVEQEVRLPTWLDSQGQELATRPDQVVMQYLQRVLSDEEYFFVRDKLSLNKWRELRQWLMQKHGHTEGDDAIRIEKAIEIIDRME